MTKIVKNLAFLIIVLAVILVAAQATCFAKEIRIAVLDSGAKEFIDDAISFTSLSARQDLLNHGTQVVRLIREGNPRAKLYMLQVCDRQNGVLKPSREAILKAIEWIVNNNIDIVNMSLVTQYDKKIEEAIIDASTSHGILFVAAAGNKSIASRFLADKDGFICKRTTPVKPAFPASSEHVISVGAIDSYGQSTSYSDNTSEVYASGKILGQEGTSFSSARITAKLANILENRPSLTLQNAITFLKI